MKIKGEKVNAENREIGNKKEKSEMKIKAGRKWNYTSTSSYLIYFYFDLLN